MRILIGSQFSDSLLITSSSTMYADKSMRNKIPELVAAVDLGSNSFHMKVSRLRNGELHTVDRLREVVRLAAGLDSSKNLTKQAQNTAMECLERFGERLRDMSVGSVRAVGTNTLRSARNSAQFLIQAEQALGHPIDIISGVEEARLIYLGVAHSLSSDGKSRLVIDIGGGSTEFIIGTGTTPIRKESLHMGCVSMSVSQFAGGEITNKRFNQALILARQELEPFKRGFQRVGWDDAVGASGTLRSIRKVLEASGSNDGITLSGLEYLVDTIKKTNHVEELDLPSLDPDRKVIFPGGVVIAYAAFKELGIKRMLVSDGALREGLLYELLGRIFHEDTRSNTVKMLADRYHVDLPHAFHVNATAQFFLTQISLPRNVEKTTVSQWIEWATQLHEIGRDIAHSQYHKHGAYILEHADMPGFGQQEQKLLAYLVRAHRRKFPLKLFSQLPPPLDKLARNLSIILRLAVLLRRSRSPDTLPDLRLEIDNDAVTIKFPKSWLDEHPLTQADLGQEAIYLNSVGINYRFDVISSSNSV